MSTKKALVLLSGGLDSATVLYFAKKRGFDDIYALTFKYGQKHSKELKYAKKIARKAGVKEHKIVDLNLSQWKGSSLTDPDIAIQDGNIKRQNIPDTYVPARNMVFLSIAASYAEAMEICDIFIGVSEVDYSGYVDCREIFIEAMEKAINLGTVMAVEKHRFMKIHAPFLHITKAEEIIIGTSMGVDYSQTWSCYRGGDLPCGTCDSCLLRASAFEKAGLTDPLL